MVAWCGTCFPSLLPRALLGRDTSPGPRQASSVPLLSGRKVRNVPTPSPASPRPTEACPLPTVLVLSPFPRPCPRPGEVFHVSADPLQAVPPWRVWLACSTRLAAPAVVATVADHSPPANPFGYRILRSVCRTFFVSPNRSLESQAVSFCCRAAGRKGLESQRKITLYPSGGPMTDLGLFASCLRLPRRCAASSPGFALGRCHGSATGAAPPSEEGQPEGRFLQSPILRPSTFVTRRYYLRNGPKNISV